MFALPIERVGDQGLMKAIKDIVGGRGVQNPTQEIATNVFVLKISKPVKLLVPYKKGCLLPLYATKIS